MARTNVCHICNNAASIGVNDVNVCLQCKRRAHIDCTTGDGTKGVKVHDYICKICNGNVHQALEEMEHQQPSQDHEQAFENEMDILDISNTNWDYLFENDSVVADGNCPTDISVNGIIKPAIEFGFTHDEAVNMESGMLEYR